MDTKEKNKPAGGCFLCKKNFEFTDIAFCNTCVDQMLKSREKDSIILNNLIDSLETSRNHNKIPKVANFAKTLLNYINAQKMKK